MKFDPKEVGEAIDIYGRAQDSDENSWTYYHRLFRNSGRQAPTMQIPLLGRVSVVQCADDGVSDSYGSQGVARMSMIFEVKSPYEEHNENGSRYFRVTGFYDSYDEVSWTGPAVEVQPKERTIISYEYV